jgi:uncharacterized protein (DUF1501 family)
MASRRDFIRRGSCAVAGASSFAASVLRFGLVDAYAQHVHDTPGARHEHHVRLDPAPDYKALVCIFMAGGNDAWNMVVPITDYAIYAAARPSIALSQATLLQIQPPADGRLYGLHPNLSGLHALWAQGRLAVACNVGCLLQPLTRQLYQTRPDLRPANLFSHSDQVFEWQTGVASGAVPTGWGGRLADHTAGLNGTAAFPMITSIAGSTVFGVGTLSRPLETTTSGSVSFQGFGTSQSQQVRYQAMRDLLWMSRDIPFVKAAGDTLNRALDTDALLTQAIAQAPPLQTQFPANNSLASQLLLVTKLIASRALIGVQRQVFFCQIGGFDTHGGQLTAHASLMTQLSQALSAFYAATVELGVQNSVTSFTMSDFGRTLRSNGTGTDHGWGSLQFVLGGSVLGGNFYGAWPNLTLNGPEDSGNQGRYIPSTAVEQYAATLARWYGLAAVDVPGVFPNIGRFASSNLGFMG